MTKDTMNIKEWADKKEREYIETIKYYIEEGWDKKVAFNHVMKDSTLGAGYKAQIRYEVGLSIFD